MGSWPWPWIGSYCIPSCITHRPLPTYQMSKKVFVNRRMDVRTRRSRTNEKQEKANRSNADNVGRDSKTQCSSISGANGSMLCTRCLMTFSPTSPVTAAASDPQPLAVINVQPHLTSHSSRIWSTATSSYYSRQISILFHFDPPETQNRTNRRQVLPIDASPLHRRRAHRQWRGLASIDNTCPRHVWIYSHPRRLTYLFCG